MNEYKNNDNYQSFFEYFAKTWFTIRANNSNINNSIYSFNLWNYNDKILKKASQSDFLLTDEMEKYIVFSNNFYESINSLIKNLTPLHLKVSVNLFRNILIMLFSRS